MNIKTKSYHFLRRLTSMQFRQKVKGQVWQLRTRSAPFLKAWYGKYSASELEAELRARLPADSEIVMVHSSISDMQPMFQGTALELLEALLRLVGPKRTLAMPAFFFGSTELYNRAYYRKHPRFDVRRTPSQMGLLTELFRRSPGVERSLHPTHSVCALGPLAGELLATHHLSPWACGERSPFGIMGQHETAIVGIGAEYYRCLTQVHAVEEMLGDQFPVPREPEAPVRVELVDKTGKAIPYEMSPPLSHRAALRVERLRDLAGPDVIKEWSFRGTNLFLTTAAKVDLAIRSAALRGETLYAV
ncbi:MAG TPA: AAC(3) family N-acetyltransferase [Candidatus Dormibacteraeota bacterium]|nr:AAC(3) family N-acetyltransferase [Candidatus Dormibacteraeota bacterium]